MGRLEAVDAAAIGYLPDALPLRAGRPRDEVRRDWLADLPTWTMVRQTHLGSIAGITLPLFASELYVDQREVVALTVAAVEMAAHIGARAVSLTGLLPSATGYGEAVRAALAGRDELPQVTTGHASTAAAVAGTLELAGRDLASERLLCLGLGSVGLASLRLLLARLPAPREIVLCDLFDRGPHLEAVRREVLARLPPGSSVTTLHATPGLSPNAPSTSSRSWNAMPAGIAYALTASTSASGAPASASPIWIGRSTVSLAVL